MLIWGLEAWTKKTFWILETLRSCETCLFGSPLGQNFLTLLNRWLYITQVTLYVNDTFGDCFNGQFRQVTTLYSDLITQVSLYYESIVVTMTVLLEYVHDCSIRISKFCTFRHWQSQNHLQKRFPETLGNPLLFPSPFWLNLCPNIMAGFTNKVILWQLRWY